MKELSVEFNMRDGSVQIEAKGFRGAGCKKATAFLEEALGKVMNTRKKPEFHQQAATAAAQTARQ